MMMRYFKSMLMSLFKMLLMVLKKILISSCKLMLLLSLKKEKIKNKKFLSYKGYLVMQMHITKLQLRWVVI